MFYTEMSKSDQLIEYLKIIAIFDGNDIDTTGDSEEQLFHRIFHVHAMLADRTSEQLAYDIDSYVGHVYNNNEFDMAMATLYLLMTLNEPRLKQVEKQGLINNILKVLKESKVYPKFTMSEVVDKFVIKYGSPLVNYLNA